MRVLIVEDDEKLSEMLKIRLKDCKIQCDLCADGQDAMDYIVRDAYDVIVLDRMLPHLDGLSILNQIREKKIETPVIMVTALGQLVDRVEGLEQGADDYLTKPFEVQELIARIRALARRRTKALEMTGITYGDFTFDVDQMSLTLNANPKKTCKVTKREADLLALLIKNEGRILPRDLLLDRVWGVESEVMESNLDNFICFLRKRLKNIQSTCKIKTVRGVGYSMEKKDV